MQIIQKGWGHEKIIHNADGYCGKILCFNKGKKCSYHKHNIKTETFYCVGKVILRYGYNEDISIANEIILNKGDSFHIPVGLYHQIEAIEQSEIFEFSTTDFPEDSIKIVAGD